MRKALIKAHRNNIARYRRLLRTHLTDLERGYLETRIEQEQDALEALQTPRRQTADFDTVVAAHALAPRDHHSET